MDQYPNRAVVFQPIRFDLPLGGNIPDLQLIAGLDRAVIAPKGLGLVCPVVQHIGKLQDFVPLCFCQLRVQDFSTSSVVERPGSKRPNLLTEYFDIHEAIMSDLRASFGPFHTSPLWVRV